MEVREKSEKEWIDVGLKACSQKVFISTNSSHPGSEEMWRATSPKRGTASHFTITPDHHGLSLFLIIKLVCHAEDHCRR